MNRPNILFFYPDQWRRDWTGFADGAGVRTPNLERLASRGVRFTNAFCPSPLCAPARACLASGLEYHRAGVASNAVNYPLEQRTFYGMLRDAGYTVLGCGKFDLHKPDFTWGVEGKHLIGDWGFTDGIDSEGKIDGVTAYGLGTPGPFLTYLEGRGLAGAYVEDMRTRQRTAEKAASIAPLSDEEYGDNWVAGNGLELLSRAPSDRPWFLQVNFPGPHNPFDITASMAEWYRNAPMPEAEGCDMPAERVTAIRRNYSAMTENIDRRIGDFIDLIDRRGALENTLVIFSSDHGEMLGDRSRWGKNVPYTPSLGVPFLISGPGIAPASYDSPVTNLDITATILEAAGLPLPVGMDSRSLVPVLSGKEGPGRTHVTAALKDGKNDWRAVMDEEYKLIVHGTGNRELYRYRDDPFERSDLSGHLSGVTARMEELLPPPIRG